MATGVTQAAISHKNSSVAPRGSKQFTTLAPVDYTRSIIARTTVGGAADCKSVADRRLQLVVGVANHGICV